MPRSALPISREGLFELARQNPLPAVLIGAGVALLLGLSTRSATKGALLPEARPDRGGVASPALVGPEAPSRRRSLAADDLARQAERGYSRVSQAAEELRRQAAAAPEPVTRAPDTRRAAKRRRPFLVSRPDQEFRRFCRISR